MNDNQDMRRKELGLKSKLPHLSRVQLAWFGLSASQGALLALVLVALGPMMSPWTILFVVAVNLAALVFYIQATWPRPNRDVLANISHEVRTPINAIVGMANLILDTELCHPQREYLEGIRSAADRLLTVINDIQEEKGLEAGSLRVECADFDIHSLLRVKKEMFGAVARRKGLEFSLEVDPSVPQYVNGDASRVCQVLNNLVHNAVKFTPAGRVEVRIAQDQNSSRGDAHLIFEITDTGIGIAEKDRARIFEPYAQGDVSSTRRFEGAGLGLSISRRLVEMMGGQIGLEHRTPGGSKFWFTLPYKAASGPVHTAAPSPFLFDEERPLEGVRILIVEDNPVNQKIASYMLEKLGARADAVGNGREALAALLELPYDLILMDCQMPEMDGYDATRIIRSHDVMALRRNIPIIAMTANAIKEDREKCFAAGMDDYLSKPVASEELGRVIRKWIRPEAINESRKTS